MKREIQIAKWIWLPALAKWGLDGLGISLPPIAAYGAAILGLAGVAVSLFIWVHVGWTTLRTGGLKMGPAIVMIVGLGIVLGGAIWAAVENPSLVLPRGPGISFQKYALFWVQLDGGVYQIGAVGTFFNQDGNAYRITAMEPQRLNWTFIPRGGYNIRGLFEYCPQPQVLEDSFIRAGETAAFKQLLPLKYGMTIIAGQAPDLVVRGEWNVKIENWVRRITPLLYTVYEHPISRAEWDTLLKSQSKIKVDDLIYKPFPPRPRPHAPLQSYLMFNGDPSATIDDPYLGQTPAFRGPTGVMIFVRGNVAAPTEGGWQVLGRTYEEVWADPKKLSLYNSIFPAAPDGSPRPFGYFAGAEQEMWGPGAPEGAPVTRAADILEVNWSKRQVKEAQKECRPKL